MLSAQENAWCVYTALFLFFSIILTYRCRNNILLIPFAIFGILMTVGNICLLAAHYGESNANVSWVSKSLVLSLLPAASVLVFLGIMEAQLIFIRHIATAINNRDHWGSLYLRKPEKKRPVTDNKRKSAKPWTYYTSLASLAVYTLVAICYVILLAASSSITQKKLGSALCVTLMLLVVCFNTLVIMSYSRSTSHVRLIRRNRDDMLFLKVTPVLFSVCMAGMTALSWIYYLNEDPVNISIMLWIVLESLFVDLPLIVLLIMCIYTGKIKKMGRQYRIETDQRSFNDQYSYKTIHDIESVTKKISQEESNKLACPPPPSYQRAI